MGIVHELERELKDDKVEKWGPKSMQELLSEPESESVSWVVESYVPQGALTVLCAYPKTGKSTFVYSMGISIAQGKPFLGKATMQGAVLILAVEEHRRDVIRRLRRFGATEYEPDLC